MIFLGRILQVDDRDEYYKTVIGVETGYTTDVYIIRISHNKIEKNGYIKLFFQRNRLTFGTVAQPRDFITLSWLYNKFKDLKEGDKVIARGWRYKTRTSLSFIEKIE